MIKKSNFKKNLNLIFFSNSCSLINLNFIKKQIFFDFESLIKQDKLINLKKNNKKFLAK
jgi:hypothetical protein